MASNDIGVWYRGIPDITRYWFTGSVVLPLLTRFHIIDPYYVVLSFDLVLYKFQIWRPVTAVLSYYPLSIGYLFSLYFLYRFSRDLESDTFSGRQADFAFMLLFNWTCLIIAGFLLSWEQLMRPMVYSIIYIWCQHNRDQIINFWFVLKFKAMYLPWVLFAFNYIISDRGMDVLLGIFLGHLYHFLEYKYPLDFGGARFLHTPRILYKYFPNKRPRFGALGFGYAPASRRRQDDDDDQGGPGHSWGHGQVLRRDN